MILPPEVVPPRVAAVVWAVVRGARSQREIAKACGWKSHKDVWLLLNDARRLGLIDFEPRVHGTLRPVVDVVAYTPPVD